MDEKAGVGEGWQENVCWRCREEGKGQEKPPTSSAKVNAGLGERREKVSIIYETEEKVNIQGVSQRLL